MYTDPSGDTGLLATTMSFLKPTYEAIYDYFGGNNVLLSIVGVYQSVNNDNNNDDGKFDQLGHKFNVELVLLIERFVYCKYISPITDQQVVMSVFDFEVTLMGRGTFVN